MCAKGLVHIFNLKMMTYVHLLPHQPLPQVPVHPPRVIMWLATYTDVVRRALELLIEGRRDIGYREERICSIDEKIPLTSVLKHCKALRVLNCKQLRNADYLYFCEVI